MNPNASNYDSTAGQLPNGLIVAGGSCNDSIWDQNYFGVVPIKNEDVEAAIVEIWERVCLTV
jgi:uncharacterized membrane protein